MPFQVNIRIIYIPIGTSNFIFLVPTVTSKAMLLIISPEIALGDGPKNGFNVNNEIFRL